MFLKRKLNNNFIFLIIILSFFISVLLTGERSNTIKALMSLVVFISIIDIIKLKTKLLIFLLYLEL